MPRPDRGRGAGPDPSAARPESSIHPLLRGVKFTSIYADWLRTRGERLEGWFRSLPALRPTNVLLLNATKGQQLYPSVVDFFVSLQRVRPNVRVTSVSYFDEIFDLARGVAEKGLEVVPVSE